MKTAATLLATLTLLVTFQLFSVSASAKDKPAQKVWSRWTLSANADIYYRVELASQAADAKTTAVEFLSIYKKDVSFCFAITKGDSTSKEGSYQPVFKLKKNKSTVVLYPTPASVEPVNVAILSVEVAK